ncbi:2Fe-2S iron-sulfur cluster binding domain-containing protein [Halarcobacter anaerophilus]|jgi:ferredoxin|uniref:2Fe-2S iron-sulfur cluster binding domain-containing protein n=1 Tax=Halarcobacter anaerophilus TaxID=877500 RepID=UPI0005C8EE79|nr:2Fe-2S iron-sulfur cluster binding domain-containing protein [Halarcobacter anaerophilus]
MKHNILVRDKSRNHTCHEDKSLMDGLNVYENLVPKGCHNGACGVCKIHILNGEYSKSKMNRRYISQEDEDRNIVLACKVFPKTDMEIEFLPKPKILSALEKKVYILGN